MQTDKPRAMAMSDLDALFNPASVAIVGASSTAEKHGNKAFRNLKNAGFSGQVFAVNPRGGEIDGEAIYTSIAAIPQPVDCAFLVIPAEVTPDAVRECADAGVKNVIVASAGFAEQGTEAGKARQAEVEAVAKKSGMRIVGPNTNGILSTHSGVSLGYNASHGEPFMPGGLSIVSHSGAMFDIVAPRLRTLGAGLAKFIATGNEADLSMVDYLGYLIDDPQTTTIGLIVEGIDDGVNLRAQLARARAARKPVVAIKLGRSSIGAGAAQAHSARLAGEARTFDALLREYGAASVASIEGFIAACRILEATKQGVQSSDLRCTCVTASGAGASLMADCAASLGIGLSGQSDGTWPASVAAIVSKMDGAALIRNPIDIGNLAGAHRLETVLEAVENEGIGGPLIALLHRLPQQKSSESIAHALVRRQARVNAPVVVIAPGGLDQAVEAIYTAAGIPLFSHVVSTFEGILANQTICGALDDEPLEQVPVRAQTASPGAEATAKFLQGWHGVMTELESTGLLRTMGISFVDSHSVSSVQEARTVAEKIGYPVVLKAIVPQIIHKAAAGLVAAGINNADTLSTIYTRQIDKLRELDAPADGTRVVVQKMINGNAELIVGVQLDPALGHFLILGLGGIYTDILDDVVVVPIPFDQKRLPELIRASTVGKVLALQKTDMEAEIITIACALRDLVMVHGNAIRSIDINPVLLTKEGCIAVDAAIVYEPCHT